MADYKLLLFDADGTLFDFNRSMRRSIFESLAQFGVCCGNDMIDAYSAINGEYWHKYETGEMSREKMQKERFVKFFAQYGLKIPPQEFDELYLKKLAEHPYLLDGAKQLCEDLASRYRMAIVTNGVSSMQRKRMENSEISGFFEKIFVSGEMNCKKPDKAYFDYVLNYYGDIAREHMLIIGDSLAADILGGSNAGIDTCWLNLSGEPRGAGCRANYEARSYDDIRRLLLK